MLEFLCLLALTFGVSSFSTRPSPPEGRPSAGHDWPPLTPAGPAAPTERSPVNGHRRDSQRWCPSRRHPHCPLCLTGGCGLGLAPAVSWASRARLVPRVPEQGDAVVPGRLTPGGRDSTAHLELAGPPQVAVGQQRPRGRRCPPWSQPSKQNVRLRVTRGQQGHTRTTARLPEQRGDTDLTQQLRGAWPGDSSLSWLQTLGSEPFLAMGPPVDPSA